MNFRFLVKPEKVYMNIVFAETNAHLEINAYQKQ